ncbi:hypothetical protein HBB16_03845 [Pseudonocardia sp. MCCB 268]|nr:hypothetical protein [Pseudonocardia cytotoxica]
MIVGGRVPGRVRVGLYLAATDPVGHDPITVIVTGVLLVLGTVLFLVLERDNLPRPSARTRRPGRLLLGFFSAVMPRTAGLTPSTSPPHPGDMAGHHTLMFIGGAAPARAGGSRSRRSLRAVLWSRSAGSPMRTSGSGGFLAENQRQALVVVLLGAGITAIATLVPRPTSTSTGKQRVSALGTVGLRPASRHLARHRRRSCWSC